MTPAMKHVRTLFAFGAFAAAALACSSSNTTASNTSSNQNQPERVVLRMTKDQLQAAPAFDDDGDNARQSVL